MIQVLEFSFLSRESRVIKRNMKQFGSFLFGGFPAPVVAGRSRDIGVSRHPLHGGDVRSRIEQIADKRPSQIVGRKILHTRLFRALEQHAQHGLVR